jgi:hypothetical protein
MKERWVVIVSDHQFISKQFKAFTSFPNTQEENQKAEEEVRKKTQPLTCGKCQNIYIEVENDFNSCSYHKGTHFLSTITNSASSTPSHSLPLPPTPSLSPPLTPFLSHQDHLWISHNPRKCGSTFHLWQNLFYLHMMQIKN